MSPAEAYPPIDRPRRRRRHERRRASVRLKDVLRPHDLSLDQLRRHDVDLEGALLADPLVGFGFALTSSGTISIVSITGRCAKVSAGVGRAIPTSARR